MMRQTLLRLRSLGVDDGRVYVSLERSMRCALGVCGHCQWGPAFLCRDGPVFRVDRFRPWLELREV
jgi:NAD(P)H-flavin reductase